MLTEVHASARAPQSHTGVSQNLTRQASRFVRADFSICVFLFFFPFEVLPVTRLKLIDDV